MQNRGGIVCIELRVLINKYKTQARKWLRVADVGIFLDSAVGCDNEPIGENTLSDQSSRVVVQHEVESASDVRNGLVYMAVSEPYPYIPPW